MEASCGRTSALWTLILCGVLAVSGEPGARYVVHHDEVSFDDALSQCSHSQKGGVLTTLATQQEIEDVLAAVSTPPPGRDGPSNFWLGLRKDNTRCVDLHLPLKGFEWTKDGSEKTQVHSYRWVKEPQETCNLRCLMLSVVSKEDWGLLDSSCSSKTKHPFICKYETPGQEETHDVETDSVTFLPVTPSPDARPRTTLTPTSTPAPTSSPSPPPQQQPTQPPQTPPTQPPPPPPPASSSQPQPHPGVEKGDCRAPFINSSRSLRQHPDQPGRMTLECWSGEEVELNCSAPSGHWEVNGVRLDQLDVCGPCADGYEKDESWTCRDVDECLSAPCRLGCVNMPGSYRCVCYDAQGAPHDEQSAACVPPTDGSAPAGGAGRGGGAVETIDGAQSGILIPVLIAVMLLVVLLVVAVVVVKCCLMKRSKKRAMEKDDKVAMDATGNKDTMETTNEKEAI